MTAAVLALCAILLGCAPGEMPLEDSSSQNPTSSDPESGFNNVPEGVLVVLPRDAIPAVWEPEFLPAYKADVPGDAEFIGVSINGEARAYSINLLDRHEIVNDVVGGQKIAVTW